MLADGVESELIVDGPRRYRGVAHIKFTGACDIRVGCKLDIVAGRDVDAIVNILAVKNGASGGTAKRDGRHGDMDGVGRDHHEQVVVSVSIGNQAPTVRKE